MCVVQPYVEGFHSKPKTTRVWWFWKSPTDGGLLYIAHRGVDEEICDLYINVSAALRAETYTISDAVLYVWQ